MQAAPADSTCSHSGILTCGAAREITPTTSGERENRAELDLAARLVEHGIVGELDFEREAAGSLSRRALEHQEAPGRELAVIGHARGDPAARLEFPLGRPGAGQVHWGDGAAALEQRDRRLGYLVHDVPFHDAADRLERAS